MERKLLIDQNISNFDLIIAMKTMQANPTMEGQSELINQMLRTQFLCPALLDPEPELTEDGEMDLGQGTKIMFHTVSSPDQKAYLIAYTDKKEADKCKQQDNQHTVVTTYIDFCNIILQEDSPYAGFVINPFAENMIFTKEIMMDINKNIRVSSGTSEEMQGDSENTH